MNKYLKKIAQVIDASDQFNKRKASADKMRTGKFSPKSSSMGRKGFMASTLLATAIGLSPLLYGKKKTKKSKKK